jgi:probable lipoprotein NlpC
MSPLLGIVAVAALLSVPAPPAAAPARDAPSAAPSPTSDARARLVAAARRHLGKPFRGDCSAFVSRIYSEAKVPLPRSPGARTGTEAFVRSLARVARPRPGDVAWFHHTHRGADLFTHIALVESVDGPRVSLIHRSNRGVERLRMDLARRADPAVNGALRRRRPGDAPAQQYLASQLLAGFATPFPERRTARRPAATARHGAAAPP